MIMQLINCLIAKVECLQKQIDKKCKCGYMYLGQWNGNNTYPLNFDGCKVYVSLGEKMYLNLADGNKGNNPNNSDKWKLISGKESAK